MLEEYLVTDMAADAMERQSLTDIASAKQLSYGMPDRNNTERGTARTSEQKIFG